MSRGRFLECGVRDMCLTVRRRRRKDHHRADRVRDICAQSSCSCASRHNTTGLSPAESQKGCAGHTPTGVRCTETPPTPAQGGIDTECPGLHVRDPPHLLFCRGPALAQSCMNAHSRSEPGLTQEGTSKTCAGGGWRCRCCCHCCHSC